MRMMTASCPSPLHSACSIPWEVTATLVKGELVPFQGQGSKAQRGGLQGGLTFHLLLKLRPRWCGCMWCPALLPTHQGQLLHLCRPHMPTISLQSCHPSPNPELRSPSSTLCWVPGGSPGDVPEVKAGLVPGVHEGQQLSLQVSLIAFHEAQPVLEQQWGTREHHSGPSQDHTPHRMWILWSLQAAQGSQERRQECGIPSMLSSPALRPIPGAPDKGLKPQET